MYFKISELTLRIFSGSLTRPKGSTYTDSIAKIQATPVGRRSSKQLLTNELLTQFGILANGLRVTAPVDTTSSKTTRSKGKGKEKAGPSLPPVTESTETPDEGDNEQSDTSSSSDNTATAKENVAEVAKAAVVTIPKGGNKKMPYQFERRKTAKTSEHPITEDRITTEPTIVEHEPVVGETPDPPTQLENPWKGMSDLTIPSGLADCTFLDPEIG